MRLVMSYTDVEILYYSIRDLQYSAVRYVPFRSGRDSFVGELDRFAPHLMVYGSTEMLKSAIEAGWTGSFYNDNFSHSAAVAAGVPMLNTAFIQVSDVLRLLDLGMPNLFIRPDSDLKAFSGKVFNMKEVEELSVRISSGSSDCEVMKPTDKLVFGMPQRIFSETRWFIVRGRIIDASTSTFDTQGRRAHHRHQDAADIAFAEDVIATWLPHENCVMDTAVTEEGRRVVEFNCINCAGFYSADARLVLTELLRD